jgi:uncharacterized protein (TIGR03435 family)
VKTHTDRSPSSWPPRILAAGALLTLAIPALGGPAFKRVEIKANESGETMGGCCGLQPSGRLTATNATLRDLVQSAYQRYGFDRREIEGGPQWIDAKRFDVVAEAEAEHVIDPDGVPRQTWLMLQTLLADGFKLRLHVEKRPRPTYRLVRANPDGPLGPRLRRSDSDCAKAVAMEIRGQRPEKPTCSVASYPGRLVATALSMPSIARFLSDSVDRPVRDATGLAGVFDLELEAVEIRPPGPFGPSFRPSDTQESIFKALPAQAGLKLEPEQGAEEILVIDQVEIPATR